MDPFLSFQQVMGNSHDAACDLSPILVSFPSILLELKNSTYTDTYSAQVPLQVLKDYF